MGDTAMCINPKDPKNQWLKGHRVIVPLVGREIPVIEDRYVDIEFGTGCLKVTPAHDTNDYMLGKKHNLETIDIFNPDATISEAAGMYVGMDRMDVRKQIAEDLKAAGLMEKIEDYDNKVGYSERNSDTAVEPRLCMQWFLKMQHFADIALPPDNIQDWCISRQLWWGHRIPAYFLPTEDGSEKYVVALDEDAALEKARKMEGYENITKDQLRRDDDALDTWFSSWLWPISLFDGINNPDNEEIKYYYPTADLVTGPDIIFFWVARMIMAGYEYQGKMPFKHVYFTGIVRDKLGRNAAPAGNDILFDEALCEQGRNFNNKIWNAFRLVQGWQTADIAQPEASALAVKWFDAKLKEAYATMEEQFKQYRISEALMTVYRLFWDEFSSWYLEMIKPAYVDGKITEELWQHIYDRKDGESIMTAVLKLDAPTAEETKLLADFENVKQIVAGVRAVRNQKNIAPKVELALQAIKQNNFEAFNSVIIKMANLKSFTTEAEKSADASGFMVGTDEFAVPVGDLIDVKAEIEKAEKELQHLEGFLMGVRKKLGNENFVAHAPEAVIARERKKESDSVEKIAALKAQLEELKNK